MLKGFGAFIVVVILVIFMGIWKITAAAEKPGIDKLPSSKLHTVKKKQPLTEVRKPETKKPVDLVLKEIEVWPGYSAGPTIWVSVRNNGPNTAYDVKVCVNPGRNGLRQCQTKTKIGAGREGSGGRFLVEGGSRLTVTVTKGPKNIEKALANNKCTVNVARPKNDLAVKEGIERDQYWVNCHP